jgi:hypothetical protein
MNESSIVPACSRRSEPKRLNERQSELCGVGAWGLIGFHLYPAISRPLELPGVINLHVQTIQIQVKHTKQRFSRPYSGGVGGSRQRVIVSSHKFSKSLRFTYSICSRGNTARIFSWLCKSISGYSVVKVFRLLLSPSRKTGLCNSEQNYTFRQQTNMRCLENVFVLFFRVVCRDSPVSMATGYGLDDRRVGARVPVRSFPPFHFQTGTGST